ncbi:phage portal protein [Hutsoniella sourekii]|uniref:phage portal protein n=1 Tax=Hutsoniella sourekii TaxID=87650 RepID=UPI00047F2C0A|nr:phage portal protein [Hutsoniella sourekii]
MNRIKALYTGRPVVPDTLGDSIPISDWEVIYHDYQDIHLRESALKTVIGKIQSACSLVEFNTEDNHLNYRMNIQANDNLNSADFIRQVVNKMLYEGECLVVIHNSKFYIADSFYCDETVLGPKKYTEVVIGNLQLIKHFYANEVFHFKYSDERLEIFLKSLDTSYAKLFKRLVDVHMRNNQIRLYATFKHQTGKGRENQEKFANFLKGFEEKVRNDSVVIAPQQDDYQINESAQHYESRSVKEVGDLENLYIRQVANILQVPPLLFSGDLADVSVHNELFIKYCVRPLIEIISTEINAKYFGLSSRDRLTVNMIKVIYNSEFEMAGAVEKMIGSSVWTIDDILELQGKDRLNTELSTRRFITKNHAPLNEDGTVQAEVKSGGENYKQVTKNSESDTTGNQQQAD